jgi:sulfoxide reductase heme-binding subunit YedZ
MAWDTVTQNLGAKPVEALSQRTGDWTLRFLMMVLLVTPLRRVTGRAMWMHYRRMLGLYAFFYACLHFFVYVAVDLYFSFDRVVEDIVKRPYITLGFLAFIMMIPLVATSTGQMMRSLGKDWKKIHQLVYPITILGVLHFTWQAREDMLEPLIYAAMLMLLLGYRAWVYRNSR